MADFYVLNFKDSHHRVSREMDKVWNDKTIELDVAKFKTGKVYHYDIRKNIVRALKTRLCYNPVKDDLINCHFYC